MSLLFTAFDISLALSVFAFGLRAQGMKDVRFMLERPRLTLLSLLAMYVVTPVLALATVVYIAIPDAAAIALVALSFSMIPPLLPQKEIAGGGTGSYAIGLVITVAVLAPVGIPLLVDFLGRLTGRPYGIDAGSVALLVLKLVLAPLLAGLAVGSVWPRAAASVARWAPRLSGALMLVALVVLLVLVLPSTWTFLTSPGGVSAVAAAFVVNLGALGIGHLMGGPDRSQAVVLALSCASRHPALALSIATANYPTTGVAVAVVVVQVINGVVCTLYLRRLRVPT